MAGRFTMILGTLGYFIGALVLFFANFLHWNVHRSEAFWLLFFLFSFITLSYGLLLSSVLSLKTLSSFLKKFFLAVSGCLMLLFFISPFAEYILNDLFLYYFHAKIFVVYQRNPYRVIPQDFSFDPDYVFVSEWSHQNFNYGPLWLILSTLGAFTQQITSALWLYKAMILIFFLASIFVFYYLTDRDTALTFLFAVNPLFLYWGVLAGHNDVVMIFFVLLAFYFLKKQKDILSAGGFALAVLIKPIAVLFFPFMFLRRFSQTDLMKEKLIHTGRDVIIFLSCIVLGYLPFGVFNELFSGSWNLQNSRLTGALFSLFYEFFKKTEVREEPFVFLKKWFLAVFAVLTFGYMLLLIKKKPDFKALLSAVSSILIFFYLMTFWFQPWYMMWVVPFLLAAKRKPMMLLIALIWYSLEYFVMFYTFLPAVGMLLALMVFVPLAWWEYAN